MELPRHYPCINVKSTALYTKILLKGKKKCVLLSKILITIYKVLLHRNAGRKAKTEKAKSWQDC